jgi:hypothetical protein
LNVAFVGVTHHFRYTKSSQFFIDLLNQQWPGVEVMSSEWRWVHLPKRPRWDLAVFWQHFPEPWEVGTLNADRIVLVPMEDDCPHDRAFWEPFLPCRVLCFCRALADLLEGWGHQVFRVQYYPPAPERPVDWPEVGLRAFFWPRKPELSWKHIAPLLQGGAWQGIHYHHTETDAWADPAEATRTYPVKISSWYPTREALAQDLARNQVYFAPRRCEGIGLSFLEALGLGMAVVAVDRPTMNEYIESGVNGWLYNPDQPNAPDWSQARAWGLGARQKFVEGRQRWLDAVPPMLEFLTGGPRLDTLPQDKARANRAHRAALRHYAVFQILNGVRWFRRWFLRKFSRGNE